MRDSLLEYSWAKVTLPDRPVFFWAEADIRYNFERQVRGVSEMAFCEVIDDFGPNGESGPIGIAISHVGDLMVTGSGDFIEFASERARNQVAFKVPDACASIYL